MVPLYKGGSMTIWGTITSGPKVYRFNNGKAKTVFSCRYDQKKNDNGETEKKYMEVEAWGRLAKTASYYERGDDVHIDGEYQYDKYRSDKKGEDVYILRAERIFVQEYYDTFADETEDAEPDDLPEEWEEPPAAEADNSFAEAVEAADGELPL